MASETYTARVGPDHKVELVLPDAPEGTLVSFRVQYELPPIEAGFQRRAGSAAGKVRIIPNFDDPLEEFETEKY